ncbi:hypothetical protein Tco_1122537 [Tanacetum coccineum]|uniref:Uncharacterized protein n=1 Tax=Tanacetum coccineum TaxID=301880 RepID=A0ABQ5J351_9ASTR
MKALWIYWARGDNEVELTDEESSDSDDEDEVAKIFRIETNLFDFEMPLCKAFKEFNYLLQIDPDVLTKDIDGFKTYKEYKDDWIYEWNKDMPWVHERPWAENGVWKEPTPIKHHCGGEDWTTYDNTNSENKRRMRWIQHEEFDAQDGANFAIKKIFEIVINHTGDDEEYVAIKENEYNDLTNTSKDTIHAYQEIFRMIDEGWMVTRTECKSWKEKV